MKEQKPHIIIIGAGFGGIRAKTQIKQIRRSDYTH